MYICLCNAIPQEEVEDFLSENPSVTNQQIIEKLKIGSNCATCLEDIYSLIDKIREGKSPLLEWEEYYDD